MSMDALSKLEKQLKSVKIEGFIIQLGNERVFEYLKNRKIKDKPSKIYSITKSIVSLLIGILVDSGAIHDIHSPIYEYFPELLEDHDVRKRDITIFHLLTMTSGLKPTQFQGSKRWIRTILEQTLVNEPGTTFQYNSGDSHLLSAIIRQVAKRSTSDFAADVLFRPLGINKYSWVEDPQGIHSGGFGLSMNMEDMLKIGFVFLHEGKFDTRQVVSQNWIKKSQFPEQIVDSSPHGQYGYGFQLWTFSSNSTTSAYDYFYANGLFGQFIFVVPKLELIAVVTSHLQGDSQTLPVTYFEEFLCNYEHMTSMI